MQLIWSAEGIPFWIAFYNLGGFFASSIVSVSSVSHMQHKSQTYSNSLIQGSAGFSILAFGFSPVLSISHEMGFIGDRGVSV